MGAAEPSLRVIRDDEDPTCVAIELTDRDGDQLSIEPAFPDHDLVGALAVTVSQLDGEATAAVYITADQWRQIVAAYPPITKEA